MPWQRCVQLASLAGAITTMWLAVSYWTLDDLTLANAAVLAFFLALICTPFIGSVLRSRADASVGQAVLLLLALLAAIVVAFLPYRSEPSPNGSDGLKPIAVLGNQIVLIGAAAIGGEFLANRRARKS